MGATARPPHPVPRGAFVPFDRGAIEQSIPARFEQRVEAYPRRLALKMGDDAWTYAKLDRAANRVTHALVVSEYSAQPPPGTRAGMRHGKIAL